MPMLYNIFSNTSYYNYYITSQNTGATVPGNGTTSMSITGLTNLSSVAGQDDSYSSFPVNFDFYFYGTNYGNGLNSGIYWNTNNVLGFGPGNGTITWAANTGKGILLGNYDRRTNNFYYSNTQTSSGYSYITCLLFAQNVYNDGVVNAIQYQIRIFRGSSNQYVEIRCKQPASTAGSYNITDGTSFKNTFGSYTNMIANQSFVLQSDSNGNNWTFFNNYYINI